MRERVARDAQILGQILIAYPPTWTLWLILSL
jgi:hypothetical protein